MNSTKLRPVKSSDGKIHRIRKVPDKRRGQMVCGHYFRIYDIHEVNNFALTLQGMRCVNGCFAEVSS